MGSSSLGQGWWCTTDRPCAIDFVSSQANNIYSPVETLFIPQVNRTARSWENARISAIHSMHAKRSKEQCSVSTVPTACRVGTLACMQFDSCDLQKVPSTVGDLLMFGAH